MPIKPVKDMVAAATAEIENISVADAQARMNDDDFVMVDIRDPRELDRDGRIPGAMHAPRGMLEFRADPASPFYDTALRADRPVVLHCASGGRAALAGKLLKDMGYGEVYNVGGFAEWKEAGAPVEEPVDRGMSV